MKLFQVKVLKVEQVRSSPAAENSAWKSEETKATRSRAVKAGDTGGWRHLQAHLRGSSFSQALAGHLQPPAAALAGRAAPFPHHCCCSAIPELASSSFEHSLYLIPKVWHLLQQAQSQEQAPSQPNPQGSSAKVQGSSCSALPCPCVPGGLSSVVVGSQPSQAREQN